MSTFLSSTALPRTTALGGALAVVAALALSACGAAPDNASTTADAGGFRQVPSAHSTSRSREAAVSASITRTYRMGSTG